MKELMTPDRVRLKGFASRDGRSYVVDGLNATVMQTPYGGNGTIWVKCATIPETVMVYPSQCRRLKIKRKPRELLIEPLNASGGYRTTLTHPFPMGDGQPILFREVLNEIEP